MRFLSLAALAMACAMHAPAASQDKPCGPALELQRDRPILEFRKTETPR
jgi:hypothetical protein